MADPYPVGCYSPVRAVRHHALHPVPTRRSSDLGALLGIGPAEADRGGGGEGHGSLQHVTTAVRGRHRLILRVEGSRGPQDRKSTRLNSSHTVISYAVFCLKKKNKEETTPCRRYT